MQMLGGRDSGSGDEAGSGGGSGGRYLAPRDGIDGGDDRPSRPAARPAPTASPRPAPKASTGFDDMDDDIPF